MSWVPRWLGAELQGTSGPWPGWVRVGRLLGKLLEPGPLDSLLTRQRPACGPWAVDPRGRKGGWWRRVCLNEMHLLHSSPNQHHTLLSHLLSEGVSAVNGKWVHLKQQSSRSFSQWCKDQVELGLVTPALRAFQEPSPAPPPAGAGGPRCGGPGCKRTQRAGCGAVHAVVLQVHGGEVSPGPHK